MDHPLITLPANYIPCFKKASPQHSHLFFQSLSKHLLSTHCVPGITWALVMKWMQTWPRAHPLRLGPLVIWLLSSTQVTSLRMPGKAKQSLDTHYPSRHPLSSADSHPFHLHLANSYSSFRDTIFCEAFLSYPG